MEQSRLGQGARRPGGRIYVTVTTTLPAARLYLFDEDDKIYAEQIAFFAEPRFRSSGWITGAPAPGPPDWRGRSTG